MIVRGSRQKSQNIHEIQRTCSVRSQGSNHFAFLLLGRTAHICVDGKIVKIGGSQAKGGIDGTYSAYFSGFAPKMSLRTYCVWNFMKQAIDSGKIVEVYCVWADTVTVDVPTMTGSIQQTITIF